MTRTARVDPEAVRTSRVARGITQMRLPMRGSPLRYVNAYAIEENDGITLLDCGWKADDVLLALSEALAACGWGVSDVRRVLVTHFHHDHYGLAATLRRAGVESLGMHAADWRVAEAIFRDPGAAERASDAWLARNGFAVVAESPEDAEYRSTERAEPTLLVADGATMGRLRAIWTPGHSPGHLCFVDLPTGVLLSGDHVLDPITPHVGIWFEDRGDPLGDYLASLRAIEGVGDVPVLPAHGEPFQGLGRRVAELLSHHAARDAAVRKALEKQPMNAAEVARTLTWMRDDRPFHSLSHAHQQFAVAETIAHLEHARTRGLVVRDDAASPLRYAPG